MLSSCCIPNYMKSCSFHRNNELVQVCEKVFMVKKTLIESIHIEDLMLLGTHWNCLREAIQ